MTVAHPIARAWLSTGGTGAQNYDEFADDAEITAIIAANPASALAIEMPHRAPESVGDPVTGRAGRSFTDSLPAAVHRLDAAKAAGRYAAHEGIVAPYRIPGAGRPPAAGSVAIDPCSGLVTEVTGDPLAAGVAEPLSGTPGAPSQGGTVHLHTRDGAWALRLPPDANATVVDNLDHALVERRLLGDALGLDPGDKRTTYVGGDYPPSWLFGPVDAGRADLAVLIAPVTVDDFVAVNLARQKMPRKSTWFTPKARAGLVVADLGAEG